MHHCIWSKLCLNSHSIHICILTSNLLLAIPSHLYKLNIRFHLSRLSTKLNNSSKLFRQSRSNQGISTNNFLSRIINLLHKSSIYLEYLHCKSRMFNRIYHKYLFLLNAMLKLEFHVNADFLITSAFN